MMSLNANSRVIVSVPADTKIYVVFTKHEQTPSELHKVSPTVVDCPLAARLSSAPWPSAGAFLCLATIFNSPVALRLICCCVAYPRNVPVMRPSLDAHHARVKVGPHDPVRSWAIFAPDDPM